ncbi:esterase-like activity of phytase family protein [Nocardia uniformis]|uniref:Esterase-like activity of phytase family protein n=1 Tax=Nocardia uniformis TaxID=53432 RepID=A0A849CC78_9NOCA|nr:esterase-like activity of phytase family protein [Nocardia uniformis]
MRHAARATTAATLICTLAVVAACSSDDSADFTAGKDHPLTITIDDLLAKTGGTAAVAITDPEHGTLARGVDGSLVYTPQPGYTGTDTLTVTTTDAVRLFTTDIPALGTFGGVEVQGSAFGSALTPVPGAPGEFYGLTDRGPNVDGPAKNEKIVPMPEFVPQIGRFRLVDNRAELISTIELKNRAGVAFNGVIDTGAETGETMRDLSGTPQPATDHGLDPEGLVALPDGTFWVSDEYGPFLVHFDATGTEIERLSPGNGLPAELSQRTPNQGMEGLTVTPDGTTLVGVIQSGLRTPGLESAREVPMTRIVTIELKSRAVREFAYPLENPKSKLGVSEITALSDTTFVVGERDGKAAPKADKKLWTVDISGATDIGPQARVPGAHYDPKIGLLIGGMGVETYVGLTSTADGIAALQKAGITPVDKQQHLDLAALVAGLNADGKFFGHDKIEGIATTDGGRTLYIANDSDFGLDGVTNDQPPFTLKPKTLPNGLPDTGEILMIDTSKLPARTETTTVTIEIG